VPLKFSIITPSFNQLDWLRLCVASVRDQVGEKLNGSKELPAQVSGFQPQVSPTHRVEHIIQDAGTPGIEEFAREIDADFYRDGVLVLAGTEDRTSKIEARGPELPADQSSISQLPSPYRITIHCEPDNGMYDAINKGLERAGGDIFAYLNCDEQYLPFALQKVADFFSKHAGNQVAFGDTLVLGKSGEYICQRKGLPPGAYHTLVSGNLSFATASAFFRSGIIKHDKHFFPSDWKAIGDAVWALGLCKRKYRMAPLNMVTSTFGISGENLGVSAEAKREVGRLRASASVMIRFFAPLILLHYRLRKALRGGYLTPEISYAVFTLASPGRRVPFKSEKGNPFWTPK
jgi:glycosyltransferase involved in cell wall biosynthesis